MNLFLDSANIDDIRFFMKTAAVQGVTTNPSLMAKEDKGDYFQKLDVIADAVRSQDYVGRHLSVEVTTLDPKMMVTQALELYRHLRRDGLNVHIKVPCTELEVITNLSRQKIPVNATAVMTPMQGMLAWQAGAAVISFFYNRIKDHANETMSGPPPAQVLREFRAIAPACKVICGSIRKPEDIYDSWIHGANHVTASRKVIEQALSHPQTDKAIKQFQEDITRWQG